MTRIVFRPIDQWPGDLTANRNRRTSPFQAGWSATTVLLVGEVEKLGHAPELVLQVAAGEEAMRLDGGLRASAQPEHPGVIVSFPSKHGPLRYHTDVFTTWQANVRAIALGLEALRRVDRYGIGRRGEQYTGWKAIGSAPVAVGSAPMTVDQAESLLLSAAGWPGRIDSRASAESAWKAAARKCHPDVGGDPAIFRRITEARDVLIGAR